MFVKKQFMLLFENIADSIVEVRRLKQQTKNTTYLDIFDLKELSKWNVKLLVFIALLDTHS